MASPQFCNQIFRPVSAVCVCSRLSNPSVGFPSLKTWKCRNLSLKTDNHWAIRLSLVEPKSAVDVQRLVGFLYDDLPHLFDDQGIDQTAYDEGVIFRDPITKHDSLSGYLFNIAFLKILFSPKFQLHWVKQTGPYEITTRWTMVMKFMPLPWQPELVFTGTSVMSINPENGKFISHVDFWDSIEKNDYFSFEGLWDVFKQLRIYKTPDLETPKYQILKRTANYEGCPDATHQIYLCTPNKKKRCTPSKRKHSTFIDRITLHVELLYKKRNLYGLINHFQTNEVTKVRQYTPFIVVETNGNKLSGSTGFNDVAGYIFGKNSTMEKIPMTTPVFTQALDAELSKVSIQIVLPLDKEINSLPNPNREAISLRKVEGGIAAVVKFSGKPTEEIVREKEKVLRSNIIKDGLKPKMGCLLARYNDPGRTWSFTMRNEVLIWLEEFSLV